MRDEAEHKDGSEAAGLGERRCRDAGGVTPEAPVLSVRDLRVYYGTARGPVRAVDRVSLEIAAGEVLGLVGESGCGKSTLGRGILGLLPPGAVSDGRVLYGGRNVVGMPRKELARLRGPDLGLIFQEPMTRLNPLLRIEDHFRETLERHEPGLDKRAIRKRSLETLGKMGIPPTRFRQYPHEFSGGMRQRIMIALALVLRPRLLVADEPTTSLDVIVEAQILSILADLKRNFGTALLLITHNLGIIAEACDRVAVMYAGKIVEEGPARDVFADPAHPYTRELLRSTISLETRELHSIPGAPPNLIDPPAGCRFHPRCPDAMRVCAWRQPIEVAPAPGGAAGAPDLSPGADGFAGGASSGARRVECWLHGPEEEIPPGQTADLERGEIAVAEEA